MALRIFRGDFFQQSNTTTKDVGRLQFMVILVTIFRSLGKNCPIKSGLRGNGKSWRQRLVDSDARHFSDFSSRELSFRSSISLHSLFCLVEKLFVGKFPLKNLQRPHHIRATSAQHEFAVWRCSIAADCILSVGKTKGKSIGNYLCF